MVADECSGLFLALIAGAFTIAGALVGAAATMIAAKRTAKHQHALEKTGEFRAAFVEELIALRRGDKDVYQVLNDQAPILLV